VGYLWLLVCHVLEPNFEAAYGHPHLFRDPVTGELKDVWEPVIANALLRRRKK
jgi:hypothetical protein